MMPDRSDNAKHIYPYQGVVPSIKAFWIKAKAANPNSNNPATSIFAAIFIVIYLYFSKS